MFQDAPAPLFLVAQDGTVQRVNRAAGDLIGAKPGYATGRPFGAFVAMSSRAALNSQLTAVGRTGKPRRLRCSLIAEDGEIPCELVIGRVGLRGVSDDAGPLVITVRDALPKEDQPRKSRPMACPSSARSRPSPAGSTWSRRWPGCCSRTRASASPGPCSGARA